MNIEQIEQAKKKADELIKYNQKTDQLCHFIRKLEEEKYLTLETTHQSDMWSNARETFELVGVELIELLKKKLWEREDYLEKLEANDLIEVTYEEE